MKLAGKVAVVTGAGSGIGKAIACLFAKKGAKIVVADIDDAAGEETVAMIKAAGGEAIFVHTDVLVASEVEHLILVTKDKFGEIGVLVNNVGISHRPAPFEMIEESFWDRIYAVNVRSVVLMTKYTIPEMRKAGGGVIINMGSISGIRPRMYLSAYASTKGAVNTLTKALALELAPNNIRVNAINPSFTDTPTWRKQPEDFRKESLTTIPLGHAPKPEDVAYAALYLASDESSMLTGTSINVDGGRSI